MFMMPFLCQVRFSKNGGMGKFLQFCFLCQHGTCIKHHHQRIIRWKAKMKSFFVALLFVYGYIHNCPWQKCLLFVIDYPPMYSTLKLHHFCIEFSVSKFSCITFNMCCVDVFCFAFNIFIT